MGSGGASPILTAPGPAPTVRNATQCTLFLRSYATRSNPTRSTFSRHTANAFVRLAPE